MRRLSASLSSLERNCFLRLSLEVGKQKGLGEGRLEDGGTSCTDSLQIATEAALLVEAPLAVLCFVSSLGEGSNLQSDAQQRSDEVRRSLRPSPRDLRQPHQCPRRSCEIGSQGVEEAAKHLRRKFLKAVRL